MNSKNKVKKKTDWLVILLDILIVITVFVILWSLTQLAFYWKFSKDSSSFMQDASSMSFELERNDYAALIQGKYINEINGDKKSKSYHALADYIEAASKYKVYSAKGYAEKASKEQNIMDRSRIEMDRLTIFADRVDKLFETK